MEALLALLGVAGVAFVALILIIKNVLYVCQPNEVLIFSGRQRTTEDGKLFGYKIIRGGRAIRTPLFETVDRMDLTNMIIEVQVKNAYSRGGIPLNIQGVANIKVPGEEPLLNNTVERFLGRSRDSIMKTARETLEGNLRGVLATMTPEQVNTDKETFAQRLAAEAEHDLNKLGLVLDTLKIQNVSDEVGYLDAMGRQRAAAIRRDALIAEAVSQAQATEQRWTNTRNAELTTLEAHTQIALKENERRIADAQTRRAALIAQQQGEVEAIIAQARAEVGMQDARIEQVRRQLQADIIAPADAARRKAEEDAKGHAARIIEQGRATAQVLTQIAATYNKGGAAARDVLLMQKLVPLFHSLAGTIGELKIDRLTILPKGTGSEGQPLGARLVDASEQIKAAIGIDVPKSLRDALGDPRSQKPPLPRTT
ncbi:flotillin family protein [Nannocystis bainbridge]|uniref:SPFH domain-containing protein n=1 Tax=Nannocystis bainbridge TaxID=2995303 RepID=A0ABT5DWQ3_9BACT|nr:flotillin family protein [Nannocystis bainbridge]MDC0717153.1 SPFH domain-containing protein [Nannocystis bainbridge]